MRAPMEQKAPEAPVGTGGKVVAIALVALLAVCFVGSCSVGAVALVSSIADNVDRPRRVDDPDWKKPKVKSPLASPKPRPADEDDDQPPAVDPLAMVDDDSTPPTPDDDATPPVEPGLWTPPEFATAEFAVYHPTKAKADGWKTVQKLAKAIKLPAYLDSTPDDAEPPYLIFRTLEGDEYAPIGGETLELAHGLSQKERDALLDAKSASVVDVTLPLKSTAKLQEVTKLMADLQKATGGVLWDEESQEYFSPAEWKKRRLDGWEKGTPDGLFHFTVYVTDKDGLFELQTGGLAHFGLPELKLSRVPGSLKNPGNNLINVLAQQLIEGTIAAQPGEVTVKIAELKHKARRESLKKTLLDNAQGQAEVTLVSVGTVANPTLELTFPGSGSTAVRLAAAITGLFGASDRVDNIEHDAELKALSAKQMQIFASTIKKRFEKGLKAGESLLVKAPFPADSGGNEWMWVEVKKLKADGTIIGTLANEPNDVADLLEGDEVVVVEAEVFDWILKEKNGTQLGNETGKVMLKRLGR